MNMYIIKSTSGEYENIRVKNVKAFAKIEDAVKFIDRLRE